MKPAERIRDWYRGNYFPPPTDDPFSYLVFTSPGYCEPPELAKGLRASGRSWLHHWKWIIAVAATSILALKFGAVMAQGDATNLEESQPAAGSGCLGKEIHLCVQNAIERGFDAYKSGNTDVDSQIASNEKVDVNGRKIRTAPPGIYLSGTVRGLSGVQSLHATYDRSMNVTEASFTLSGDPSFARTLPDYAHTGMFFAFALMLGDRCPTSMSPQKVYRFFENQVKPAIVTDKQEARMDETGTVTNQYSHTSEPVRFCGAKVTYSNLLSHESAAVTVENPTGIGRITEVDVSE
jgi:hypothetical protein